MLCGEGRFMPIGTEEAGPKRESLDCARTQVRAAHRNFAGRRGFYIWNANGPTRGCLECRIIGQ